jgi:FkbM family methyltransferase
VDYAHARLQIYAETRFERRWRAGFCRREPWTVSWLEEQVRPGDVVYDIGANVGVFSLIAGSLLAGEGLVVAFEPAFSNYARLCENVALNGLPTPILPVPLPLSSTTGVQSFVYRSLDAGQSRHRITADEPSAKEHRRKRHTQPMLTTTLDTLVHTFALRPPNLVKLDVDGAEGHVLAGAGETLQGDACRSILVEIDDEIGDQVVAGLEASSFRLSARHRRKTTSTVWYGVFDR